MGLPFVTGKNKTKQNKTEQNKKTKKNNKQTNKQTNKHTNKQTKHKKKKLETSTPSEIILFYHFNLNYSQRTYTEEETTMKRWRLPEAQLRGTKLVSSVELSSMFWLCWCVFCGLSSLHLSATPSAGRIDVTILERKNILGLLTLKTNIVLL